MLFWYNPIKSFWTNSGVAKSHVATDNILCFHEVLYTWSQHFLLKYTLIKPLKTVFCLSGLLKPWRKSLLTHSAEMRVAQQHQKKSTVQEQPHHYLPWFSNNSVSNEHWISPHERAITVRNQEATIIYHLWAEQLHRIVIRGKNQDTCTYLPLPSPPLKCHLVV